jgi:hypothetical protein
MLETESNRYLDTEDNGLNSANDSLYSVIGILNQLQKLGDRYVLLGELRGDLMDVTGNADMDLQEISNFTATADNPYLSTREFYAVINNCNYFLQNVDTTVNSGGNKVMLGEYAVVKAIRAWTYLQLGLNFGKVVWLTRPVLTIDDMNRNHEIIGLEDLLWRLYDDMQLNYPALRADDMPKYGNIDGVSASSMFIPRPALLGDIYLWLGALTNQRSFYAAAAETYYQAISNPATWLGITTFPYTTAQGFYYSSSDFTGFSTRSSAYEVFSLIHYNTSFTETMSFPPLMLLTTPYTASPNDTYKVKPSQAAMNLWSNEMYIYNMKDNNGASKGLTYTLGDLRGILPGNTASLLVSGYYYGKTAEADSVPVIGKYLEDEAYRVTLYRAGTMYLRYAEALNGAGYPSLAFAVLKYGLGPDVLSDTTKVAPNEIRPLPSFCNFTDDKYNTNTNAYNRGIHGRGAGDANVDTVYYAFRQTTLDENRKYYGFPETLDTQQDSIIFVNAMICKELALETAFEGNRFQDLMRLSRFYENLTGKNDFLAKWVARRKPEAESVLANPNQWYLPSK